jgi:hypothetical protein
VRADRIGDSETDLQTAVDTCRRSLGLPAQFGLTSAAAEQLELPSADEQES